VLDYRYKLVPFKDDRVEIENDEYNRIQAVTRFQGKAHLLNLLTSLTVVYDLKYWYE
jgi:hypothetical protein